MRALVFTIVAVIPVVLTACGGKDCPEGLLRDNDGNCVQAGPDPDSDTDADTDADYLLATEERDSDAGGTADERQTDTYDCP